MDWFGVNPRLAPDESVLWQERAGLCLSRATIRGTIYLTSSRLEHVPSRFTRSRDREIRAWPLEEIKTVWGVDSRDRTIYRETTPHGGSMRKRLHVRLKDGTALLFIVKRRDDAVAKLQGMLERRSSAASSAGI